MTPALTARGLRVALGGVEVLHGVDVDIAQGRWTAIAGPNGAGKTTLLKALAHLLPCRGEVTLLGRDIAQWPHKERARAMAWLGQGETGSEDLLARDVVMLGRLPHQDWLGTPSAADRAAVEAAMRETQSWDWRDRALGQLSGGERQRVLLARALAVQASVLLMDEPLGHLDPPHQADWLAIVRRHVARGGTAVSVLHEITMALQADELLLVDKGRIVHHGACSDAETHRALEQVFEARIAVHQVAGQWAALPREKLESDPDSFAGVREKIGI
ncbi:ABC transporter ATP-binding protein [Ramlibacter albus]|uniref:ABC transporter ATP-binding protein n=1 Tax=Ramlibacter albus TaxID=2079448 RepID=A0A923MET8_9BURK|nr:ABC transporter ATP-binding protein [Ramlibacter albus]MBC5767702.1 ABC transporter ATP-binding protein [Ramlibacter albus]